MNAAHEPSPAKGFSGNRPELVDLLVTMLNAGVHPFIPEKGSVGASGDLAPLAHLALAVIGEGEAFYRGERLYGAEALRRAGLAPLQLAANSKVVDLLRQYGAKEQPQEK